MDSSEEEEEEEDDEDEGEEWRGDRSSAVSPPSAASMAVTQRSTAGGLHRSTSEDTHTSVWTGDGGQHTHTHTRTGGKYISSYIVKTRRQEKDNTESGLG